MDETVLIREIAAARGWLQATRAEGLRVGLVPTMGALHEGHLSLARAARETCDRVVASIFVNPTQFGPSEDLERYPRDLESDLQKLAGVGVDAVFAPSAEAMYPPGAETQIDVGSVARGLEGATRPTHFSGVATVVMKLLGILPADRVYFGRKDYQQTVVVGRMLEDLNSPVEMIVCPIVRDPDGLAMSSRNAYLSPDERGRALVLSRSLRMVEQLYREGQHEAAVLLALAENEIRSEPGVELDYLAIVREGTVDPVEHLEGPAAVLVAARVGRTRLIDNTRLA